ncbi:hypothetical protein [Sphingomonas sp.]|uniref:hypothetical protein n=1 Tax=Sphingomonas sp. TaxID=28214 RepID=UPI003CC61465
MAPGRRPPPPSSHAAARLRGDTWLVARPGGGESLAFGQLGASQAGARVTYAVDAARRIALSARLSTPLSGHGREAAVGVDWQPTRLPVHLLVEERLPLDSGSAEPAVALIGGAAVRLPLRITLETYAQGGAVHRRGAFADGSARLSHALLRRHAVAMDVGAGVWGAAQRDASRFDIGPELGVTLPVRGATVRLAVDYRRRVGGRARPGSGPALVLGGSF